MEQVTKSKVYRVAFYKPVNGKTDYYFGSLAAIFKLFTSEQIGCALGTLYAHKFLTGKIETETPKCRITTEWLFRSKQREAEE